MERIVLFRFHENQEVCRNRMSLIRRYNPGVPIYGLYGGQESIFPNVERLFGYEFSHLYCLREKKPFWNWANGDLAVREWYQAIGKTIHFDMLHLVEWDLLLLDSLDEIYRHIPKGVVGITGLIPLKRIEDVWFWSSHEEWWQSQWEQLLSHSREKFFYSAEPYASQGPGTCLPKEFLDRYSECDIPELCHDEVRLPLFAQNLGFDLHDTSFYTGWFNQNEEKFFNCKNTEIRLATIRAELGKAGGRRAFHPYRRVLPQAEIENAKVAEA